MGGVKGNISEKMPLDCKINPLNVVLKAICTINNTSVFTNKIKHLAYNIHYTPNSVHNYGTTNLQLLYFPFKNEHTNQRRTK